MGSCICTDSGITTKNLASDSSVSYGSADASGVATVTISEAGTYVISGGTVSGSKITDHAYDFRYTSCDLSDTAVVSTVTAN